MLKANLCFPLKIRVKVSLYLTVVHTNIVFYRKLNSFSTKNTFLICVYLSRFLPREPLYKGLMSIRHQRTIKV
jgi:hypothetical protein